MVLVFKNDVERSVAKTTSVYNTADISKIFE